MTIALVAALALADLLPPSRRDGEVRYEAEIVSGSTGTELEFDESGKVVSAHAVNGHPLLVGESVRAASQARFSPTILGGQPVKVSGVITYNFVMQ